VARSWKQLVVQTVCALLVMMQVGPSVLAATPIPPRCGEAGGLSCAQKGVFGQGINIFDVSACGTGGSGNTSASGTINGVTKSFGDPSRNNRKVGATIYAPTDSNLHPLVIFAPGQNQNSSSDFYKRYLQAIANAGYVVVGANFSDNNSSAAIPSEAADIKFLIGQALQDTDISSHLNKSASVAVIGHSDGGYAALIAGYGAGTGQQDDRIGAVIEQDGNLYPGESYKKGPSLFIMHGTKDTIEKIATSAPQVFSTISTPYTAYAAFNGADHNSYISGQPSAQDGKSYAQFNSAVDTTTQAFLDRELNGSKNNGTSLSKVVAGEFVNQITLKESGDENTTPGLAASATTVAATTQSSCCQSLSGGTLPSSVPAPYNKIFTDAAQATGADPLIIAAIFLSEHGYTFPDPPPPYGHGPAWATSASAGAQGPFQFLPTTWVTYGQGGDIQDLKAAAPAAGRFIVSLGGKAGIPVGSFETAMTQKPSVANVLGSYNAGPAGNFNNGQTHTYITDGLIAYNAMSSGTDPVAAVAGNKGSSAQSPGGVATPVVDAASGSCGDAAVAGNIIQTAEHYAWDTFVGHTGPNSARPEYQAAWTKYDHASDMTDCSAFVATVLIATGIETDKDFPRAGTTAQMEWYKSHPNKYQIIPNPTSTAQLKPGDILIHDTQTPSGDNGHTMIYIGDSKWQGADASLGGHTPQVAPDVTWMFAEPNDMAVRVIGGGSSVAQSV